MSFIDEQLVVFKNMIEESIINGGAKGKESMIRSSALINLIHDAVKKELIDQGVHPDNIFPHLELQSQKLKWLVSLNKKIRMCAFFLLT